MSLTDKTILLGISGSIAAYKTADWVRHLRREGAAVRVVMTKAATQFVSPLTFAALSGNRVHCGMFEQEGAQEIPHITLGRDCDLLLLAPATAQTIARLAHGLADDLLAATVLAAKSPVLVCPAMNSAMYLHPATQANLARIRDLGYRVIEPESGSLACGEEGPGRLPGWAVVREEVGAALAPKDLAGRTVMITAGPTWEPLDPVRFLGNRSTGRMGYALARTARRRGAEVILISGPTELSPPPGVQVVRVRTALEMQEAVQKRLAGCACLVMAAAVSDYRPVEISSQKIKKGAEEICMALIANPDILRELGRQKKAGSRMPLLVGFAAESSEHRSEGLRKLRQKNMDLIAVNDILGTDTGFGAETNRLSLIDRDEVLEELPLLSKEGGADRVWDKVTALLA